MRNETLYPVDGTRQAGLAKPRTAHVPGEDDPLRMIDGRGLKDRYGRRITYIRLSVTDRCDFRCTYCMAEEMTFLPRKEILSLEECLRLVRVFASLGVTKVRLTGGEPLVRNGLLWLAEQAAATPGIEHLVMTTNGSQLERYAARLRAAGVRRLNISLDTLDPQRFKAITRVGDINKVLRGIDAACAAGFERVKLNTVMIRGVNDHDFSRLVEFAAQKGIDIAFIEEMPLGNIGHGRSSTYLSSDEALASLQRRFPLVPTDVSTGGPARYWQLVGSDTRVGFISPHSHNFCETCNRVRITAKGELYPCLGHNDAVALLPVLRDYPDDEAPLRAAIAHALYIKPEGHEFSKQMENPQVVRFMSMTGG